METTSVEQAAASVEAGEGIAQGVSSDTLSNLEADALGNEPSKQTAEQSFEIKVNGKVQKVTLDELKKGYSLEAAARRKMEEAASFKKENDYLRNVLRTVKEDPTKFLDLGRALGVDVDELSMQLALKKAKYEMMEPHERELHDTKEEVERLRKERERFESQTKKQEYESHYNAAASELHDRIQEQCKALNLNPASKASDRSLIHAAVQLVYDNFDDSTGRSNVTLERALQHVKKQRDSERKEYLSTLDDLPPELVDKVRKRGVEEFRASRMQPQNRVQGSQRRTEPASLNVDDYFKQKELQFKRKA